MTTVTRSLRDEHRELAPRIESLQVLADRVGELPTEELLTDIEEAEGFLMTELLPHAAADERSLYPAVGVARVLRGNRDDEPRPSGDHGDGGRARRAAIGNREEPVHPSRERELRRLLYGLHAVIRLHFQKVEELDPEWIEPRLSSKEAEELIEAMELATKDVRRKGRMPLAL
jgi:Hemerythrin HHE cation binding domain